MTKNTKLYDKAFVTGCDAGHEWILPWFFENFRKHMPDIPLIFADFGVENLDYIRENVHAVMDLTNTPEGGWFKKPRTMLNCPAKKTVWIDTDCEILCDVSDIFDQLVPGKLNMVKDKPWSMRFQTEMYNSGIVGFVNKPPILSAWAKQIQENPARGDQETLYAMLDPLANLTYINPLPNEYNWLRLQIENDNQPARHAKIIHWTGPKGKERIRSKMNG